ANHFFDEELLFDLERAGKAGGEAKDIRTFPSQRNAADTAHGGAEQARAGGVGQGPVLAVDFRFEFFYEKAGVTFVSSVVLRYRNGSSIFAIAGGAAIDRDDDNRAHFVFGDEAVCGSVQFPVAPTEGHVRSDSAEGVLTVVDVQHGIAIG